jgi:GT2 family glycosyltransferase
MTNTELIEKGKIGVVTVTYNSGLVLQDFFDSLAVQTHQNFVVYVVDNASHDDTLGRTNQRTDMRIVTIVNAANLGVAEGNNQGIRAALSAGCECVLLLNNDTAFPPDFLEQLYSGLDLYHCDMTTSKMYYYDEPKRLWCAGGAFQPWFAYRHTHVGMDEIDIGQYDLARRITYVPTCCVLIKKGVFEKIGLMDPRYFVYWDDVDFMYRAMKAGIYLMYLPEARLLHKVGRLTGGEDSPFAQRYCTRNRVYFILKYFGIIPAIPILALYQMYFVGGLLGRKFNLRIFWLKQKAFLEGLVMGR